MKKWIALLLSALMGLSLTACGDKEPPTLPGDGFTCQTTVQYKEMTVEGTLTYTKDGKLTLACTLPKSLYGVTLGYDDTGMTMGLGKMQMAIPAESVPQSALIGCLAGVLTARHNGGELTDEGYVYTGQIEGVDYTLVCDSATGLPVSLAVPSEELTAVFADGQKLSETE